MNILAKTALAGLAAAGAFAAAVPAASAMPVQVGVAVGAPVTQVSWPCGPYKHPWRGYCVWNRPVYYAPPPPVYYYAPPPVVFGFGWGRPWGWGHPGWRRHDWR